MKKKIIAFVSSRKKNSNTLKFVNQVKSKIDSDKIDFEVITSRGMNYKDIYEFDEIKENDDILKLQEKLIGADFIILASPIMVHNISTDMKALIERSSSWGHIMRLFGKKSYVITTNYSNGHMTGINYLSRVLTTFGTEVIGASNASEFYPKQLHNNEWLDDVTTDISSRINKEIFLPQKSNKDLETIFQTLKDTMNYYKDASEKKNDYNLNEMQCEELKFWIDNKMSNYDTFEELLRDSV